MSSSPSPSILVVDDEPEIRDVLIQFLRSEGYHDIQEAESAEAALMNERRFDLVITDYRMSGMTGAEFIRARRMRHDPPAFLLLSGDPDAEEAALKENASFLSKPPSIRAFLALVRDLLEPAKLRAR